MGKLVEGDDGLPAEDVGTWAKDKHLYLRRYIDISWSTRAKYLGPGKGGAGYVDLAAPESGGPVGDRRQSLRGRA